MFKRNPQASIGARAICSAAAVFEHAGPNSARNRGLKEGGAVLRARRVSKTTVSPGDLRDPSNQALSVTLGRISLFTHGSHSIKKF